MGVKRFLILLQILCATMAFGAVNNYYVATTGSDSNDGSSAHPWKTINHADAALGLGVSGTVVHVLPGSYAGPISTSRSGTSSQRIVFVSDTKWAATISNVNWLVNGSYVDINGFDMTAPGSGGWAVFVHQPASFVHIINNNMHDFTTHDCGSYGIITTGQANPIQSLVSTDNVIANNIIRHGGNYSFGVNNCVTLHGVYSTGKRDIIESNVISGITGWAVKRNGYAGPGIISANTLFNNGGGISPTEQTDSGFLAIWDYNAVTNNIIVNNGQEAGKRFGIDYYHVTGTHNLVSNNLVYGNQPSDYGHHDVTCTGGTPISGSDANGTAGGCPSTNPKSDANTGVTFAAFHIDSNGAPDVGYNVIHYKLGSGSSGVGGGTASCASSPGLTPCTPAGDFDGIAVNSPPEIGAYSFGVSSAPSVCLSVSGLTFASRAVGTTSTPQTASITNCGTATLSSIAVGNSNTTDFGLTYTGPSSLSAGATSSNTISVVSHPSTGGGNSGTISVTSNAATKTIALSGSGNVVATAPNPPTSLNVSSLTSSTINLAWTASSTTSPAITNYKLYRGTSSGGETLLTTVGNVTSYADTTVSVGNTYYYKATAVNANGESAFSNEISQTVSRTLSQSALLVSFGVVAPLSSSTQTITLTKTGTVNVAVTSVTSSSSEFTVSSNTCGTLSTTCTFDLTFSPTVSGAESAIITIVDDASGNPHHITVVGGIQVGATISIPGVVRIQ